MNKRKKNYSRCSVHRSPSSSSDHIAKSLKSRDNLLPTANIERKNEARERIIHQESGYCFSAQVLSLPYVQALHMNGRD